MQFLHPPVVGAALAALTVCRVVRLNDFTQRRAILCDPAVVDNLHVVCLVVFFNCFGLPRLDRCLEQPRMTLEDIHEGWIRNADTIEEDVLPEHTGAMVNNSSGTRMLLPSFLRAFTSLARIKYCTSVHEGDGPSSVNRLLLRDVFDNITNPTVSTGVLRESRT